jgi:NDP-sugar pyrophosphorylase family protein
MKAMVLAAGLGTRLKPVTHEIPKALVPVNGVPLLDIVLHRLIRYGFTDIIVNVHHFAGQIIKHIEKSSYPGAIIAISDESEMLMDTGGAILKARWFLDGSEPFLIHNVDIISTIDLMEMWRTHSSKPSLATLAVSDRVSSRYFLFDPELRLWGWENLATRERIILDEATGKLQKFAFSGIHIISPEIYRHIHQSEKFSIISTYLEHAALHPIFAYLHDPGIWFDVGKMESISSAEEFLKDIS